MKEISESQLMYRSKPRLLIFFLLTFIVLSGLLFGAISIYADNNSIFTSEGEFVSLEKREITANQEGYIENIVSPLDKEMNTNQKIALLNTETESIPVLSPIKGVLEIDPKINNGRYLSKGEKIGTIISTEKFFIITDVAKKDIFNIQREKRVTLQIEELGIKFEGMVKDINFNKNNDNYAISIMMMEQINTQVNEGMKVKVIY